MLRIMHFALNVYSLNAINERGGGSEEKKSVLNGNNRMPN